MSEWPKKKWKRRSKLLRRNSRDPQIISTYQESLSAVSATTASRLPVASSGRTGSGHKLDGGNDRGIESANPNTNQHQPSHRSQIITLLTLLRKIRRDKMKRSGGVFPEEDAEYFAQVEQSEKRQCFQATPCPSRRPKPTKVTPQSTTRMTRHVGESADSEKLGVAIQSKRPSHGPDQGFNTLSDLIYVRSQWDAYLAPCMMPGAHAIPSHFPQPSPPSWPEWSLVLSNICTSEQDTTMK
ncbi:uncharacterized protein BJ171DRAFT_97139 [Polychytrium aggregatum]|uniref:uncharacterized protein n=1 Tax=Polychytrium aggregatum TaxID=110093 RepID=UPI0022FE4D41|nr:uncharacterized protein BJ171DRAFT_97139 [Polychytrium aggregatum]KAI9204533.1 hypothetical protein BJ171DRAFT_97139 [Polychytrium aggregatum]